MKNTCSCWLLLLLGFGQAFVFAEVIPLADGSTVEGEITKVEPHQITVMTSGGIRKIPFKKVTPEFQQKHGFDPEKAENYVAELATKSRAVQEEQAKILAQQRAAEEKKAVQVAAVTPTVESLSAHQDSDVEALRKELQAELDAFARESKPGKGQNGICWKWIPPSGSSPGYHEMKPFGNSIEETPWMRAADARLAHARSLAARIKISLFRQ